MSSVFIPCPECGSDWIRYATKGWWYLVEVKPTVSRWHGAISDAQEDSEGTIECHDCSHIISRA